MSHEEYRSDLGLVGNAIENLLPTVNDGFNWELVTERYDDQPVGTAMGVFFTDEEGEEPVERVYMGIAEGPRIVILDGLDDRWDYIGSIVTYQDFGLRILDPDDDMTPDRARHQYGGVDIHPAEGQSKTRVWLVTSNVLDVLLESVIWKKEQEATAAEGGD